MTRSNKPQGGGAAGRPWTPDQAPQGVTCPACGLANEAGARVCRNCGLPIASTADPLRGVKPGHVDLPTARRSGLSGMVGLAMVIGLLLVGGTLAVSGGGILNSGGRLGVAPDASASPAAGATDVPRDDGDDPVTQPGIAAPSAAVAGEETANGLTAGSATAFDYTCDDGAIVDLSASKWQLSRFTAGLREDEAGTYERITWEMSKRGSAQTGTTATMEWTTPKEARTNEGATLVTGSRAIVVTFDGPVDSGAGQQIDQLLLEPEGIEQIRTIDMFEGDDGKVRTVIGIRGDSCARMSSVGWSKKGKIKNAKVYLDVERF
jgi:hypothetical protein